MKLTHNFWLDEFIESRFYNTEIQEEVWQSYNENKDTLLPNIQELANNLQKVRECIKQPIYINIGYRPLFWEIKQGRSGKSQHVLGKAVDIRAGILTAKELYQVIAQMIKEGKIKDGGLGLYSTWVHYDIADRRARW